MRLTLTGNKNIKNLFTIRKQIMIWLETEIYVTYFLKTSLTKFVVIWVKRCQKAGFLTPRSSKITETKEKERRKRNSEEKERRRREKSNGCTLSFYNSYSGDSFWRRKLNRLLGANGPVGDNVFKWIRLDIHYYNKKSKILICNW